MEGRNERMEEMENNRREDKLGIGGEGNILG